LTWPSTSTSEVHCRIPSGGGAQGVSNLNLEPEDGGAGLLFTRELREVERSVMDDHACSTALSRLFERISSLQTIEQSRQLDATA
jgi:hypothetical protein